MSRAKREGLAEARATLLSSGLPEDAAEALASLEAQWGNAAEAEIAAVLLAGESVDVGVAERLASLLEQTATRSVKREIKRSLYRLAQRGVWQAPRAERPPRTADLMGSAESEPEAWLTPVDGTGHNLLWLARRRRGGMLSLWAIVSEVRGIREIRAGETSRRAFRDHREDLAQRMQIRLTKTPWEWVYHRLLGAWETTADQGRFPDFRRTLDTIAPNKPGETLRSPIETVLDRDTTAADEDALAASAEVLATRTASAWLLPQEWLEKPLRQIQEAQESVVILSPTQREGQVGEIVDAAIGEVLDPPERRDLFSRRLEETAFLLADAGETRTATAAFAAAIAASCGRAIDEIPVLAELVRKSIAVTTQAATAKQEEEVAANLVVTPAQAMAEQTRRRR